MPDVIVAALFRGTGPQREHWRSAFQRLGLGFLIHAQHDSLVGGVEIQADEVADLGFELRVGGELETLRPPGLQPPLAPHLGDLHIRQAQLSGQQPARPVRHPQPGRRRLQRGQHHRHIIDGSRLARLGPVLQPADALGGIPPLPEDHRRLGHPRPRHDLAGAQPIARQQHDPRPPRQPHPDRRRTHPRGQHLMVAQRNLHGHSQRHKPSSANENQTSRYLAHGTLGHLMIGCHSGSG